MIAQDEPSINNLPPEHQEMIPSLNLFPIQHPMTDPPETFKAFYDAYTKRYHCPGCPKLFAKICDFRRHLLVHTKDKPFACEFCPSKYTRKELLKYHYKTIHRDKFL